MRLYYVEHYLLSEPTFVWAENEDKAVEEWKEIARNNYAGVDWDEEDTPKVGAVWAENEDKRYRGYVTRWGEL